MINITNEDNMELMARYENNHFDLAIVDPPYGIGESSNDNKSRSKLGKSKDYGIKNWDNSAPNKEYFTELKRVSKNVIIWGANHFIENIPKANSSCWIVWDKQNGDNDFADCELAYCSFNSAVRKISLRWHGMLQHDMKNKEVRIHPTQKPVKLYEWLLMNYAECKTCNNEGGYYEDVAGDGGSKMFIGCEDCYKEDTDTNEVRILDTHLGSGSIALACHNLGYNLTACELDTEYFDAATKRLKQHQQQLTMF